MSAMQAEVDAIIAMTPWVGVWFNWMSIILLCSVLFAWWHVPARWVLLSVIAIIPTAVLIFTLTNNINLVGISHIIYWIPLCWYLYKKEFSGSSFNFKSLYGVWLILVSTTIVISLLFDVYDAVMVMLGLK